MGGWMDKMMNGWMDGWMECRMKEKERVCVCERERKRERVSIHGWMDRIQRFVIIYIFQPILTTKIFIKAKKPLIESKPNNFYPLVLENKEVTKAFSQLSSCMSGK